MQASFTSQCQESAFRFSRGARTKGNTYQLIFLGDANNDSLQRVYGISFPDKKQLTEYKAFLAEAARRDHRKIGKVSESYTDVANLLTMERSGTRIVLFQRP